MIDLTLRNILLHLKGCSAPSPDLRDLISSVLLLSKMDLSETMPITNPEAFLKSLMDQGLGTPRSDHIFNKFRPIHAKAFAKANFQDTSAIVHAEQFSIFIGALCVYAIMLDSFRKLCSDIYYIDEQSAKIVKEEFLTRYEGIRGYGLAGCDNISSLQEAGLVFEIVSAVNGESFGVDDWINYLHKAEVSLNTHFGVILQPKNIIPSKKTKEVDNITIDSSPLNSPLQRKSSVDNISTYSEKSSLSSTMQYEFSVSPLTQMNFTISPASSLALKNFVSALGAYTANSASGQKLRLQGFKIADQNGTGLCNLQDLEGFIKHAIATKFSSGLCDELYRIYRPSFVRAFAITKVLSSSQNSDSISITSFRLFNACILIYAAICDTFRLVAGIDGELKGGNDEVHIDRNTFTKRFKELHGSGFVGLDNIMDEDAANSVFDLIKTSETDAVSYSEWVDYVEKAEIRMNTEMGRFISQKQANVITIDRSLLNCPRQRKGSVDNISTYSEKASLSSQMQSGLSVSPKIQVNFTIGLASSLALKTFVSALEPYTIKSVPGQKLRLQGFKIADQNGTGRCTLQDLEGFIKHALAAKFSSGKCDELHRIYHQSYARAFAITKLLSSSQNSDSISITSFRLFIVCILIYAAIYDAFRLAAGIDGEFIGGNDEVHIDRNKLNGGNDEVNLDRKTFTQRFRKIKGSGFVGLDNIMDEDAANSVFDLMKTNNDDTVSYSEWVDYVEKAETRMNTELGQFVSQKQYSTPNDSVIVTVTTKTNPLSSSKTYNLKPLEIPSICSVGLAATSNLRDFVETFKPYTEKTVEGQKLRAKEFKLVNLDGSGRCSLADLETFIKRLLATRFETPRTDYLFHLFRPSFARAYVKAQAFNFAKKYVSFTEFRIFSVYTCIYASMFDAFSKMQDNDKIKSDDFEAKFGRLHGYDFAALGKLYNKEQARDFFLAMDRSARGYVEFDDFCYSLEKFEVSNRTTLGEWIFPFVTNTMSANDLHSAI